MASPPPLARSLGIRLRLVRWHRPPGDDAYAHADDEEDDHHGERKEDKRAETVKHVAKKTHRRPRSAAARSFSNMDDTRELAREYGVRTGGAGAGGRGGRRRKRKFQFTLSPEERYGYISYLPHAAPPCLTGRHLWL